MNNAQKWTLAANAVTLILLLVYWFVARRRHAFVLRALAAQHQRIVRLERRARPEPRP